MASDAIGSAHGHPRRAPNAISLPWVVVASVLMGVGVLLLALWLVTYNFLLLGGAVVLAVGFGMVFDQRMGSDHA